MTDLIVKAKQIEYLINSLPEPESEEEQVSTHLRVRTIYVNLQPRPGG